MAMSRKYETTEPPRAVVDSTPGPLVLEFGASWCGFCKAAQPAIEAAFVNHEHVKHLKISDGKGQPLGRSFAVKLWPTLVFLRDGKECARLVRSEDEEAISRALATIDS